MLCSYTAVLMMLSNKSQRHCVATLLEECSPFLLLKVVYTLFVQQVGLVLFLYSAAVRIHLWRLQQCGAVARDVCVCMDVGETALLSSWNKPSECFVVCRINHSPREHGKSISDYQLTMVMYLWAIIFTIHTQLLSHLFPTSVVFTNTYTQI